MRGYRSGEYAASLAEFGTPRPLGGSGGWVLDRPIPGQDDRDATGCYPLFACRDWSRLAGDLGGLGDLVSLVLVADPFGDFDPARLGSWFNRGAIAFKRHHVVELGPPVESLAAPHHRRNARKALGRVEVERSEDRGRSLGDWIRLYEVLVDRHEIRGIARFSAGSFARQLAVPGLVAFRAEAGGSTVGMILWMVQDDVAYYHLGAYDEAGYALNASFALFWRSIEWFTGRARWLDLGAGAGTGRRPGRSRPLQGGLGHRDPDRLPLPACVSCRSIRPDRGRSGARVGLLLPELSRGRSRPEPPDSRGQPPMIAPGYRSLVEHYEACLDRHGDTPQGVDWPRPEDVDKRHAVMLGVIREDPETPVSLLDFGCGAAHLLDYLIRSGRPGIRYSGLDLSAKFVGLCRSKHPGGDFRRADLLEPGVAEKLPRFDYVVASGVFTEKRAMSHEAMVGYFEAMVPRLFGLARLGIAFNVMAKHVDWERDDLFHLPMDDLARFLCGRVSRHFVVRSDYGLYEYTVYVYREPPRWPGS